MAEYFTEKQKEFVRKLKTDQLKRLNILYGSVRSGKTWITLVVFAAWVSTMPLDKAYIMCAKSLTTLKRNCLDLLQEIIGEENFSYSLSNKQAWLFGRKIYLEGANDSRSEGKIRGMTLQGAYVDEITLIEQNFFTMLLSRLSEPKAKLFGSTNPDSPSHWLKKDYIDRANELDMNVDKFIIDDNTFLDPEYVKQIKQEYVGVFYDRFILGKFVLAEGIIYPMYEKAIAPPPQDIKPSDYCISIDYGTMNAFAALLWAKYGSIWHAVNEYYYSGRDKGITKTDEEYADAVDALAAPIMEKREKIVNEGKAEYFQKIRTIVDPSAASFITTLRKRKRGMYSSQSWYNVIPADNDVVDGIRDTATAMELGLIKISPNLNHLIDELRGYVWDSASGEDRPLKINDHACDALRYHVFTNKIVVRGRKQGQNAA